MTGRVTKDFVYNEDIYLHKICTHMKYIIRKFYSKIYFCLQLLQQTLKTTLKIQNKSLYKYIGDIKIGVLSVNMKDLRI